MADPLFLGRSDELARFRTLRAELSAGKPSRLLGRSRGQKSQSSEAGRSRVVLVHGLGGSGKSRLLRQFQAMADGASAASSVSRGQIRTAWLDWEDEQRERPSLYAGADGPSLLTVLDAVQHAVIDAIGADARSRERAEEAFAKYRDGAARMPQYAAQFANVIAQSNQPGSHFTSGDAAALLRSLTSIGLALGGHPGGVVGLSPDQLVASTQAAGHLSEAAVRAVTGKKPGDIPLEEYDLVTDPARELTRRVARALRAIAAAVPLGIFLDTGEVIGGLAWGWLRRVMTQTGSRVIWAVGARFETEAEAGVDSPVAQFVRDIGDAHLILMLPTRFDDEMIREYLASRTPGRSYAGGHINLIAWFTRGLPLAVSLAAELLEHGEEVEDVCTDVDQGLPSSVVSSLARRYLVHAEQDYPPGDPRHDDPIKILGLALAYADLRADPGLLAALWDVTDPLAAFQDLSRRHDFVLPLSRRLHDDVRDTLRTDLLDPYRREQVRAANQRALELYRARLAGMRGRWPTLDEQIHHAEFKTALLALLWHTLWLDNQTGLDLFMQMLPVLAIADHPMADATAEIVNNFAATFNEYQLRDLDQCTKLTSRSGRGILPAHSTRIVHITHPCLALQQVSTTEANTLVGEPGDRQAAMAILQQRDQTIETLRQAARSTNSARLRRVLSDEVDRMATEWLFGPPDMGLMTLPAELLSSASHDWILNIRDFLRADRIDDALADFDLVIRTGQSNLERISDDESP